MINLRAISSLQWEAMRPRAQPLVRCGTPDAVVSVVFQAYEGESMDGSMHNILVHVHGPKPTRLEFALVARGFGTYLGKPICSKRSWQYFLAREWDTEQK